jgi:glycosyltransferase involved in cell wall biosynthesis
VPADRDHATQPAAPRAAYRLSGEYGDNDGVPVTLAAVVCSRDRPDQLDDCLTSLAVQAVDEVLVVDSASASGATGEVARAAGVRCVRTETPGLAHARNVAMRASAADAVAFTDDDCRPDPGWALAIRPHLAAPAIPPAHHSGETAALGFILGQVMATGEGEPMSVVGEATARSYGKDDDPSHIGHGANLTVTRSCWEALGGFDDMLGVGSDLRSGEDTDFLWRALRGGWAGCYDPQVVVSHRQWRDRRAALRTSYGYGVGAGAVRTKVRRLAGIDAARDFTAGSIRATLGQAGADFRAGYEFGVASSLVRAAGLVVGRTSASRLPLVHGHLTPR